MRILLVNSLGADSSKGGAEMSVGLLMKELGKRCIDVSLLQSVASENDPGAWRTTLHGGGASRGRLRRVHNRAIDLVARPASALERAIDRHAPDVVHTHNLPGIATGLWEVCARREIPVFHSLHDYYLLCPRMSLMRRSGAPCHPSPVWCGLRTRRLTRWSPAVRVVSGGSDAIVERHAQIFPRARHVVLRTPMRPYGSEFPPPSADPLTIGYIGSLSYEKGVDVLLEVVERMQGDACRFRFAGDGGLARCVVEHATRLPNVEYYGVVDSASKRAFLVACDVGVIPSVWVEPGGPTHALIEWLGAGRPVLASPRGGLGEVLGRYPGVVRTEPTVTSLLRAISQLLDRGTWERLVASVHPPEDERELDRWVERHLEIYASLARTS